MLFENLLIYDSMCVNELKSIYDAHVQPFAIKNESIHINMY